jgi:hypothetical protein
LIYERRVLVKRWIILLVVLPLAGVCFAGMDSNQVMRVRKKLRQWGGESYRTVDSRYADLMGFLKRENLTLEDILPEVEWMAITANDNQDPAKQDAPRGNWDGVCNQMLVLLGRTQDKRWLPFIEHMALTAHTEHNRLDAVRVHVVSCGFDSFPFLKRMVALQSDDTVEGLTMQSLMLEWFLMHMSERELSEEQKKELNGYFLARALSTTNAPSMAEADEFLQRSLPAYTNSRQRLYLAGKQNMRDPSGQMNGHFAPIKAELEKLPPSDLTDLRDSFPDLPPLPDDAPARSPVKVALAIIAGGVALAVCAVAAWLAVRRRRVRETT